MVNNFRYTPPLVESLERSVSSPRLGSYLRAAGNDKELALQAYTWNTKMSSTLYRLLQCLEITLRNALHRELTAFCGTEKWYIERYLGHKLNSYGQKEIVLAEKRISKSGKTIVPPRIVTELSFGFWISLLGKGDNYEMLLWRPSLHKAFPNKKLSRKKIHTPLNNLRFLRNRVAHHEPVFLRELESDYKNILDAISWICSDTAYWIENNNDFKEVLRQNPLKSTIFAGNAIEVTRIQSNTWQS